MTEMDVAGLGLLVSRKNSTPQHVLILPQVRSNPLLYDRRPRLTGEQNEVPGDDGEQTTPPGFNLIQLAYADDIRQPPAAVLKGTRPATRNKGAFAFTSCGIETQM